MYARSVIYPTVYLSHSNRSTIMTNDNVSFKKPSVAFLLDCEWKESVMIQKIRANDYSQCQKLSSAVPGRETHSSRIRKCTPNFEPLLSTRRCTKLDHKFAALQVCKQAHTHARTHNILIETSFFVILTRKGVKCLPFSQSIARKGVHVFFSYLYPFGALARVKGVSGLLRISQASPGHADVSTYARTHIRIRASKRDGHKQNSIRKMLTNFIC